MNIESESLLHVEQNAERNIMNASPVILTEDDRRGDVKFPGDHEVRTQLVERRERVRDVDVLAQRKRFPGPVLTPLMGFADHHSVEDVEAFFVGEEQICFQMDASFSGETGSQGGLTRARHSANESEIHNQIRSS